MESINILLGNTTVIVKNYSYSPYLNAMVNSTKSDKTIINGTEVYVLDELLNVADIRLINDYIFYISHGIIQSTTLVDMTRRVKFMRFMGHDVTDIQLLLRTTEIDNVPNLYKVFKQNDGIPIGRIETLTDDTITLVNDIVIENSNKKYSKVLNSTDAKVTIRHGNLYYKSHIGDKPIDVGPCRVSGNRVTSSIVMNIVKDGNMYMYGPHILYPDDGLLYYVSYSTDMTSQYIVTSYEINGDNVIINDGEIDLVRVFSDYYVDKYQQLWTFSIDTSRTVEADYELLTHIEPNYYKGYVLEYVKTNLYERWIRDNMYKLELYKNNPFYGCVKPIQIKPYHDDIIDQVDKLFNDIPYVIAGGYVSHISDYRRNKGAYKGDIDVFLWSDNCDKIIDRINELGNELNYYITGNAITIVGYVKYPIQIILRRYKSPTEIIHGFDVDCSGTMLYRGKFYMTRRCELAEKYRFNMWDTARMSQTYVDRLLKYKKRGFKVLFPDIRLVVNLRDKIIVKLSDYVNKRVFGDYLKMDARTTGLRHKKLLTLAKYTLINMKVDDVQLHLYKIKMMLSFGLVDISKLDYPSKIVYLLDGMLFYKKSGYYTPDYSKGHKILDIYDVEWKEQDPMTQVTSTFNPIIYDDFNHLLQSSKLLSTINDSYQ